MYYTVYSTKSCVVVCEIRYSRKHHVAVLNPVAVLLLHQCGLSCGHIAIYLDKLEYCNNTVALMYIAAYFSPLLVFENSLSNAGMPIHNLCIFTYLVIVNTTQQFSQAMIGQEMEFAITKASGCGETRFVAQQIEILRLKKQLSHIA